MNMFDLTGHVALVAGGTRGIGRAIAEQYVAQGGRVIVASRDEEASREAAREIEEAHGKDRARGLFFELADAASLDRLVDAAAACWGGLDTLVGNSFLGVAGPAAAIADDMFVQVLKINVVHNSRLAYRALPWLERSPHGSAVFIGSASGLAPSPDMAAYGIAKRALHHMVQNLAVEWGPRGVRVNAVAPGMTRTSAVTTHFDDADLAQRAQAWPIPRIGQPEEIAAACLFLAAPSGGFTTGHILVCDGGRTLLSGNTMSLDFS